MILKSILPRVTTFLIWFEAHLKLPSGTIAQNMLCGMPKMVRYCAVYPIESGIALLTVKLYTLKRALHTSEIGIAIPRVMGRRPVV